MRTIGLVGLAALVALSACGSDEAAQPAANAQADTVERPKPLAQRDPVAYKSNIESAMQEIPEGLRPDFKKLLVCTIKKDQQAKQVRPLTAEMVRELTAQLKADRTVVTTACQS